MKPTTMPLQKQQQQPYGLLLPPVRARTLLPLLLLTMVVADPSEVTGEIAFSFYVGWCLVDRGSNEMQGCVSESSPFLETTMLAYFEMDCYN